MKTQKAELPKGAPLPGGAPTTGQDKSELPEFASGNGFDPKSDQAGINRQDPITPGDVFANLESRRLRQTFDKLKTRKPLTTVGIRKPKAHEWFQAHPTFRLEWVMFRAEEEGLSDEWFFPENDDTLTALEALSPKGIKELCDLLVDQPEGQHVRLAGPTS
jgi:hypothetical protein